MRDYIDKWAHGGVSDKFCWWAISTHLELEVEEVIDRLIVEFVEAKYGPKLLEFRHSKGFIFLIFSCIAEENPKKPQPVQTVKMVRYVVYSALDPTKIAHLYIRDKMVLFANTGCAPRIDEYGLITYRTRSGINETQF